MENTIGLLSQYERLLLALLEEAGEEHVSALANSVEKRMDCTPALGAQDFSIALLNLINLDLIRVATVRDNKQRRLIPLSTEESASIVASLGSVLEWSPNDQLWQSRRDAPITDVVLTESGVQAARAILSTDGWPT